MRWCASHPLHVGSRGRSFPRSASPSRVLSDGSRRWGLVPRTAGSSRPRSRRADGRAQLALRPIAARRGRAGGARRLAPPGSRRGRASLRRAALALRRGPPGRGSRRAAGHSGTRRERGRGLVRGQCRRLIARRDRARRRAAHLVLVPCHHRGATRPAGRPRRRDRNGRWGSRRSRRGPPSRAPGG